jgi:hypothetical protein
MVTKHQDLNQLQFDDTVVEAGIKQISVKAKWLFCKDVYILLHIVCLFVMFSYCHSGGCIQNGVSNCGTCTTTGIPTIVHWYTALIKSKNTKK